MPGFIDVSGRKFNRLTVEFYIEGSRKIRGKWQCLCDCGKIVFAETSTLLSGDTQSCGCWKIEKAKETHTTHSLSRSPTYKTWASMIQRCDNSNKPSYEQYGALGITYDPEWKVFENFLADMGERPENKTLDRKDPYGNYCKDNCQWSTDSYQSFNKKLTREIHKGVSKLPSGRWRAMIHKDKIRYHLGCFTTYEEAVKVRKEHEVKLYGKELS